MSAPVDNWATDERQILAVKVDGERFQVQTGDRFERFQRPGEYCLLPWVRITSWRRGYKATIEAALSQVEVIEFASAMSVFDQDPNEDSGLEAKPASAAPEGGDAQ